MSYAQSIQYQEALKLIEQTAKSIQLDTEIIPIERSMSRVLASDILAPIKVPGFNASRMDGYAINTAQIQDQSEPEFRLPLGSAIHAAQQSDVTYCEQQAVPIMTGGKLPEDANAIIIKEHAEVKDGYLIFQQPPKVGRYIREAGTDVGKGDVVAQTNDTMTAPLAGMLSSLGLVSVEVFKPPRVALLMTGDELVQPGEACQSGQVYDANAPMLKNLLQQMGCEVVLLEKLNDQVEVVSSQLESLSFQAHDLVVSVGGVSQGDKDWVPKAVAKHGQIVFHKVLIKPGFPVLFGTLGPALYFGLPGNPVSAYITAVQFIQAAINSWLQLPSQQQPLHAELTHDWDKDHQRVEFVRGCYAVDQTGKIQVTINQDQQSSRIASLVAANCLVVLGAGLQKLQTGDVVKIQPLADL